MTGNPSAGKDVGEIEFASRFQDPEDLGKNRSFIRREIDHAIGDDDIDGMVFDADLRQVLDIALPEFHVRFLITESFCLGINVSACNFKLFIRHIDADNEPILSDEAGGDIDIPARPAAEVENRRSLQKRGEGRAAPVESSQDLIIDQGERCFDGRRERLIGTAAGIGLQVFGTGEDLAVIFLQVVMVECDRFHP